MFLQNSEKKIREWKQKAIDKEQKTIEEIDEKIQAKQNEIDKLEPNCDPERKSVLIKELEDLKKRRTQATNNLKIIKESLYKSSEQVVPEMPELFFWKNK